MYTGMIGQPPLTRAGVQYPPPYINIRCCEGLLSTVLRPEKNSLKISSSQLIAMSGRRHHGGYRSWEHRSDSSSGGYGGQGRSADVYTDGCCLNNGKSGAEGGIGVYWGPQNPLNVSERMEGRPTNQRAELQAARRAVEQARDNNITRLTLHTDSEYTVKGMTEWMPRWKENGWKTYSGGDVANKAEFQKLDSLCDGIDVNWKHVPGHRGNEGNEVADYLARSGARK
ncbi:ribonuclease H1-like isoform 1-T1 [Anomaloglossus baeobatrachus]|uniref:ribonuclease H1-like isoform X1 n=1 Tax=Anomaloglossus baeobatrachus TaxID=238106 RepID=UPI003F5093EC